MTTERSRTVDLNTLLGGANLVVLGLTVSMLGRLAGNPYVDPTTIVLAGALALQTQIALMVERRRRDPFVMLLAFTMIFFYSLRVFTLSVYPISVVLARFPFTAGNLNFALAFTIAANVVLYAGLLAVRAGPSLRIDSTGWRPASPLAATVLLSLSIAFAYSGNRFWTPANVPRALNFVVLLIAQNTVVLMAFAYLLLFRRSMSRAFATALAALIVTEAALHLLYGSRSAITGLVQNYMLVALALAGSIRLGRRYVLAGLALTPVIAGLLVWSFVGSTFVRSSKGADQSFDLARAIELTREASDNMSTEKTLELLLPPMLERIGYLDFTAEVMANRDRYAELIRLPTYAKSLIDNQLTPGFDVFDQPKISNAMRFVYEGLGPPSKRMVGSDEIGYQSDQLGLYGELFALFSFGSLPLFFLFGYTIKRTYVGLRPTTPFRLTMKRLVALTLFLSAINSFGLDWVVIETVPLVIAIALYSLVFADRFGAGEPARAPAAGPLLPSPSAT